MVAQAALASEKLVLPQSLPDWAKSLTYDPTLWPDELTLQGWEAYRAETSKRPVEQLCPTCKGHKVVMRPVKFQGEDALIYPLGTKTSDLTMACPTCGREARKQWIARNSGLEPRERTSRMHHWTDELRGGLPEWTDQRRYALACIEQAIETRTGLYSFWGDFGSGKTMALQIVVNELRELQAIEGFYAPFAVILDHLRQLWSRQLDSSTFWDRLLSIPVLAIDEVTRFDEGKGWAREKLFALVDTRYRRRESHLTVFATNENPNQTLPPEEGIGYLFSRMREGVLVELRGDVRAALGA